MDVAGATPLTVRDYLRALRRRVWLILSAVIATVLGASVMTMLQDPIYSSEAEILIEPRTSSDVFANDAEPLAQNLDRAIQTEIRVLEGQQVRLRVQELLGLATLPPQVDATADGTDVVSVAVRSKDALTAQILANTYAEAYVDVRRDQATATLTAASEEIEARVLDLQAQIDQLDPDDPSVEAQRQALVNQQAAFRSQLDQLRVDTILNTAGVSYVRAAELPSKAVLPTPVRTIVMAAIAGLIAGIAVALLVDYLDETVVSPEDVTALGGPPVLAVVPVEAPPDNRPLAMSEPGSHSVESYRGLRTNVLFLGLDTPLRLIQLTSALPAEGKTTTAANLAVVLAAAGKRVVLVDADLRKPRLHAVFGVNQTPGLTEVILGSSIDDALREIREGLHVLPAGSAPANPAELLLSQRVTSMLRTLAERFEYVIVDSSPLLPVADAVGIAGAADAVLLVAEADRVSRRALSDALARLGQVGANVLGVVLNRAPRRRSGYGRRGYGYGYGYGYGDSHAGRSGIEATAVTSSAVVAEHDRPAQEREPLAGRQ